MGNDLKESTDKIFAITSGSNTYTALRRIGKNDSSLNNRIYLWTAGMRVEPEDQVNGVRVTKNNNQKNKGSYGKSDSKNKGNNSKKKGRFTDEERCLWAFGKGFKEHKYPESHTPEECPFLEVYESRENNSKVNNNSNGNTSNKRKSQEVNSNDEVKESKRNRRDESEDGA